MEDKESETKDSPAKEQEETNEDASADPSSDAKEGRPRKRARASPTSSRNPTPTPTVADAQAAAVSAAAAATAAQAAFANGLTGLYTLLTSPGGAASSSASSSSSLSMPSVEQVRQAATRAVNDAPPYVHLSSRDSAPQLKLEDSTSGRRLVVKGGMRGYRMARASHGVSEGNYYYEVLILPPPPIKDIMASLPRNVRLGKNLQKQLEEQLEREEKGVPAAVEEEDTSKSTNVKKRKRPGDKEGTPPPQTIGGNVRIGWSMRTGDLQAPVGYDKWSYGLRDIAGSRIHNSRREDSWGGEPFGPGDVIGFAISLGASDGKSDASKAPKAAPTNNHIRFFKNGEAMGHFVLSRGKREGGAAFENIQAGTYYPAISTYMGGTVRVNFGPHFTCPPRSLPSGFKLRPVSDLCQPPTKPEDVVATATKESIFKKTDESIVTAFREAVLTEAQIRHDAYEDHMKRHLEEVRAARKERHASTGDLPEPDDDMEEE